MLDFIKRIDWAVLWWFQGIHNPWTDGPMQDVTALGGITVTILVLSVAATVLCLLGRRRHAMVLLGTVAASSALVAGLKLAIGRERPPTDPTPFAPRDYDLIDPPHLPSFPSGHTVNALVLWGSLALLVPPIMRRAETDSGLLDRPIKGYLVTPDYTLRRFLLAVALVLGAAVGVSRLYVGAHWLSDVLAAYPLGCGLLYVESLILRRIEC